MRKSILSTRWIQTFALLVVVAFLPNTSYATDGLLKDDAYTQANTPNQNFGANANLRVASNINSYLRFDLSTLPPSTVGNDIAKATLRLWVNTVTTPGLFDIRRVTDMTLWDEGTITHNSAVTILSSSVVEVSAIPATSQDTDSFVTVDLTALVKDWINNPSNNNGIVLAANASGISVRFDSKENGTTSHEPRLGITLKGLAEVAHDGTLNGDGTSGNPLGVANLGIGNTQLADGAVNGAKIAAGQVVKGLNGLKDEVTLAAGSNIAITPSSNTLTISSGGLSAVSHNGTLTGDGTSGAPLGVAVPLILSGSDVNAVLSVSNNGSGAAINATGAINTTTQYNIRGSRVLAMPGSNIFVGANAGESNTTGSGNSFFGLAAGGRNTTGFGNSFFGNAAGVFNTTGVANAFFGSSAGAANTTGCCNTFFGFLVGNSNTTGGGNAFFGRSAGQNNTTGFENSFFGDSAGQFNITGVNNVFLGAFAGRNNSAGNENIFLGNAAGLSNTTEGFNTFIGFSSNGAAGINSATAIGALASVTQSNSLVLGSINVSVGIGTTAPKEKLHVQGGSIYVGTAGQGIILRSPDGATCRMLTIDNAGALVLTPVVCQ